MKRQRIMIDGGFTCPNRDGRVGTGGCTFCRNDSFAPRYCREHGTIEAQIQAGKLFFAGRYGAMEYLAYFQSFSGTYAPVDVLRHRYDEALSVDGVVGLVIATRPDCLDEEVVALLRDLKRRTCLSEGKEIPIVLKVELGVESTQDKVLQRVNRGHGFASAEAAVRRLAGEGIDVGVHIILGLPGESREEMLEGATRLSSLPIRSVKLHQLQILKGTAMADEYISCPADFVALPTAQDYVQLVADFVARLRPDIEVERIVSECPPDMLIAPRWGLKPAEVQRMLDEQNIVRQNKT